MGSAGLREPIRNNYGKAQASSALNLWTLSWDHLFSNTPAWPDHRGAWLQLLDVQVLQTGLSCLASERLTGLEDHMGLGPKKNWEGRKTEVRVVLAFWRVDMRETACTICSSF